MSYIFRDLLVFRTPEWRNRYTHETQNLASARTCRFESDLRHLPFKIKCFRAAVKSKGARPRSVGAAPLVLCGESASLRARVPPAQAAANSAVQSLQRVALRGMVERQ